MSLRELAEARRISQHSAARLVRRHRWRRQTDNQGRVRVLVPSEALDRPADRPGAMPPDDHADGPGAGPSQLGELATAIDSMVGLLRGQLERADARADAAQMRIAELEAELRAKDFAIADAEQAARIATDALKAVRQAEEARKARGRFRRAWDGWRGR